MDLRTGLEERGFRLFLADEDIRKNMTLPKTNVKLNGFQTSQQFAGIEGLLRRPISDYRKCSIGLILAPYLIVI